MKLFLIGCTGFIGRELIPRLVQAGHKLTILSRKRKIKQFKDINQIQLDPSKSSTWGKDQIIKALSSCDGIINLAGEPIADKRWSSSHCALIRDSRLKTTQYLIETISKLKSPPKVLINGSAIGFFGTSKDIEFTEESPSGKDFLANLCNEWEKTAKQKPKKTRLVIFRIGIVLGPEGGALGKMLPVFKTGLGGPIGEGQQWMSWIHRQDLCQMIEKALTINSWKGIINAVAPTPVKMIEFSRTLGKILERPTLLPVPSSILKLLLGDGAQIVLEGQYVKSIRLKKLGFLFNYPNLNQALCAATNQSKQPIMMQK